MCGLLGEPGLPLFGGAGERDRPELGKGASVGYQTYAGWIFILIPSGTVLLKKSTAFLSCWKIFISDAIAGLTV